MFPRDLLLILLLTCILYSHSYAQEIKNNTSWTTPLDDWVIVSTIMVCSMFSVLIILVPTLLYYRYCSKEAEFTQ